MLVDPQTGRKLQQCSKPHQLHTYLTLDSGGTGLFHASFCPERLGEHEHAPYQITVLFDGSLVVPSWRSDFGRQYQQTLRAGQCYIVFPHQPHGLSIEQNSELINFYLNPSFITRVLPEFNQRRSLELKNLYISEDPLIRQLATTVRADHLLHGTINQLLVESVLNVLAFHLVNQGAAVQLKHPGKLSAFHLAKVKAFIESESTNDITIADLASITGYSAVHFSRMFKQATGQSPYQYLTGYRISQAQALLKTSSLSVAEVAYQVGFGSHAHFSTQFRRITGVSPQTYRCSGC